MITHKVSARDFETFCVAKGEDCKARKWVEWFAMCECLCMTRARVCVCVCVCAGARIVAIINGRR